MEVMGQSPTWGWLWGRAPHGGGYGAEPHIGVVMGQAHGAVGSHGEVVGQTPHRGRCGAEPAVRWGLVGKFWGGYGAECPIDPQVILWGRPSAMGQTPLWGSVPIQCYGAGTVLWGRHSAMGQAPPMGRCPLVTVWGRPSAMGQTQCYRADAALWVAARAVGQSLCYGAAQRYRAAAVL